MCFSMNIHVTQKTSHRSPSEGSLLFSLSPSLAPTLFRGLLLQLTPRGFMAYPSLRVSSSACAGRARRPQWQERGGKSDGGVFLAVTCVGVKLRQGAQAQLRLWVSRSTWSPSATIPWCSGTCRHPIFRDVVPETSKWSRWLYRSSRFWETERHDANDEARDVGTL